MTCLFMNWLNLFTEDFFFTFWTDINPPNISCPVDIAVNVSMGTNGSTVDWMVNAFDIVDGVVNTTCWIETNVGTVEVNSGDFFEVGDTLVTCNTSDAAGNTAMCGFNVTVIG